MGESPATLFVAGVVGALFALALAWVLRGRRERPVERVSEPYADALRLLADGRPAEAFGRLQQAVVAGQAPADAYVRIGRMLRERGDAARALQVHRSLTVKSDLTQRERIDVFANVAEDHLALGQPERAQKTVESAMHALGDRDPGLLSIGMRAAHALGRSEEAYEYLKELRRSGGVGEREMALYLVSIAEADREKGRTRDARRTLSRALRHDPECAAALLAMGSIEESAGDIDSAIRHWRNTTRLSPDLSPAALANLERVMYQRGTFNDIETVYRDVLDARPEDEHAAVALASFYRKQGRTDAAVALLQEHTQANPDSMAGTVLLTALYAVQGDEYAIERIADRGDRLLRSPSHFHCICGRESDRMRWHCPGCNRFDSFSRNSH
jgi:lipopolysaccharide biosynthesis regulator YciM